VLVVLIAGTKLRFNSSLWLLFGGESSSSIIYQNVVDWIYNGCKIGDGKGDRKPKPRPVIKYNNRKTNAINTEIEVVSIF